MLRRLGLGTCMQIEVEVCCEGGGGHLGVRGGGGVTLGLEGGGG